MWWAFDILIVSFLLVVGIILVEMVMRWKRIKRRCLRGVLFFFLLLSWGTIFYGSFIEPRLLVVHTTPILLGTDTTTPITIAVIGDLHLGPYKGIDWANRVADATMAQHPDLILLAGDYIATNPDDAKKLSPLAKLHAPLGVYAVLGNHDYEKNGSVFIAQTLTDLGITVLQNERISLLMQGHTVVLAGVSDVWNEGDVSRALSGVSKEDTVLLLAHNPDVILERQASLADFVIAAHTHGGQIRLPWLGSVSPIPDRLGRAYDKGLFLFHDVYDQQLFITSGVGESGPRARLFNLPVIDVLSLYL